MPLLARGLAEITGQISFVVKFVDFRCILALRRVQETPQMEGKKVGLTNQGLPMTTAKMQERSMLDMSVSLFL